MPSITCEQFRDQTKSYFNGGLDPIERFRFERHGKACHECLQQYYNPRLKERLRARGILDVFDKSTIWARCIKDSTLADFRAEHLDPEEVEIVLRHIDRCSRCDSLNEFLRKIIPSEPFNKQ